MIGGEKSTGGAGNDRINGTGDAPVIDTETSSREDLAAIASRAMAAGAVAT